METSKEIEKLLFTFREKKKESLTIDEKRERDENLKKEIIMGVFESLAKRPMLLSEYILYCERFDIVLNKDKKYTIAQIKEITKSDTNTSVYNIRNFTNDLGLIQ